MHPHMVFDIGECERLTTLKGKITFIMASCQAPINCLMWSVFSLLLRSKVNGTMEHFIVVLNGADERTGEGELQNEKQRFLEDLRGQKWMNKLSDEKRDMPITVMRTWSRIGHSQSIDMAVPWVHTEGYIILHDDVILHNNLWEEFVKSSILADIDHALIGTEPLLACPLSYVPFDDGWKLNLPHLNSTFLACRKDATVESGTTWSGHHVKKNFNILTDINYKEFMDVYADDMQTPIQTDQPYKYISADFGAWMYYQLKIRKKKMTTMPRELVTHLTAMSWRDINEKRAICEAFTPVITSLEKDIYAIEEYGRIYDKYKTDI